MFIDRCYEKENNTNSNCCGQPIMECPIVREFHTTTCTVVPHIIPITNRIINHQVYKHTYQPVENCVYENEVCNVYDNNSSFL